MNVRGNLLSILRTVKTHVVLGKSKEGLKKQLSDVTFSIISEEISPKRPNLVTLTGKICFVCN